MWSAAFSYASLLVARERLAIGTVVYCRKSIEGPLGFWLDGERLLARSDVEEVAAGKGCTEDR